LFYLIDVMLAFRFTVSTVIGHVFGEIYAGVYCILQYVYDVVVKKFTFAISSSDELLVLLLWGWSW